MSVSFTKENKGRLDVLVFGRFDGSWMRSVDNACHTPEAGTSSPLEYIESYGSVFHSELVGVRFPDSEIFLFYLLCINY